MHTLTHTDARVYIGHTHNLARGWLFSHMVRRAYCIEDDAETHRHTYTHAHICTSTQSCSHAQSAYIRLLHAEIFLTPCFLGMVQHRARLFAWWFAWARRTTPTAPRLLSAASRLTRSSSSIPSSSMCIFRCYMQARAHVCAQLQVATLASSLHLLTFFFEFIPSKITKITKIPEVKGVLLALSPNCPLSLLL